MHTDVYQRADLNTLPHFRLLPLRSKHGCLTAVVQQDRTGVCVCVCAGADPGGVLWVLKHPPSGLRYMYNIIDTASQLLTVVVYTVLM